MDNTKTRNLRTTMTLSQLEEDIVATEYIVQEQIKLKSLQN